MKTAVGGNKGDSVKSDAAGFAIKSLHPLFFALAGKPCKPVSISAWIALGTGMCDLSVMGVNTKN